MINRGPKRRNLPKMECWLWPKRRHVLILAMIATWSPIFT